MNQEHKIIFSSIVKPVVNPDKDKYLIQANLQELRQFFPNFDETDIDVLPFASSIFVAGHENLNGAIISAENSLKVAKKFIFRPTNLEHSRPTTLGVILNVGYAEFETEKPLTEEEAKKLSVFNVVASGYVWRVVNPDFAEALEESNSPDSDLYQKISSSFEVSFADFDVVIMPNKSRYLKDGVIVTSAEEKAKLTSKLKTFGGDGKYDKENRVALLIKDGITPLGIGFVTQPAAAIVGVAVPEDINNQEDTEEENDKENDEQEENSNILTTPSDPISLNTPPLNTENSQTNTPNEPQDKQKISQSIETNVKDNINICTNRKNMKITNIKEITDEALKVITASSMVEFVQDELKKASEQWTAEKAQKEKIIQETEAKCVELEKTHKELIAQVETIKINLQKLEDEKVARENQEKFNVRMASFDNKFELTDEDRKVIASQIKDLDDKGFTDYEKSLNILLKNKNKEVVAAQKKEREDKEKKNKEVKASTEDTKEVVEKAVENATQVTPPPIATTSTEHKTLREKYAKAFAEDQFEIKFQRK